MKRFLIVLLFMMPAGAPTFCDFPAEITVRGQKTPCRSIAELRKAGFTIEDIPWNENAAKLIIEAINRHRPPTDKQKESLRLAIEYQDIEDDEKDHDPYFRDNQPVFDLIARAAGMRYVSPVPKDPDIGSPMFVGDRFYDIVRDINARAAWDFCRGRQRRAVDDCLVLIRLSRRLASAQPVAADSAGHSGLRTLERLVISGRIDKPTLRYVQQTAVRLKSEMPPAGKPLQDISIAYMKLFDELPRQGGNRVKDFLRDREVFVEGEIDLAASRRNLKAYLDFLDQWWRKPTTEAFREENLPETFLDKHPAGKDPMVRWLTLGLPGIHIKWIRKGIRFDALELRAALQRYGLAKKVFPDDLVQLVPGFIEKLPVDPYSGKSYHYTTLDDARSFLFWSVGENLVDNQGHGNEDDGWGGTDHCFTGRMPRDRD